MSIKNLKEILKITGLVVGVLFVLGILAGVFDPQPPESRYVNPEYAKTFIQPTATPQLTETQKKIQLVEKIAKNYYDTHTYVKGDVFDCDNMAQDVWNMLKTQGINAKIAIGNIDMASAKLEDFNHAWVMAEIEPDKYIAVETTGGYIVYRETNPNYYRGFTFNNPKNYRTFSELYKTYQFQFADYNNEVAYYNKLVNQYNNANILQQVTMKSGLNVAEANVAEKKQRFEETQIKLNALLEYG